MLSAVIVGSLPTPSWLASSQQLYAPRRLEGDALYGPMTATDTLADEHYRDRWTLAMAFAEGLNEEAYELAAMAERSYSSMSPVSTSISMK
jgi:methionine synthase II (cobalamin-independent)